MKEKTIKDIIENGRWNWYGALEEEESEMTVDTGQAFEQFCSRMWLDNEDENLNLHAAKNRMTKEEYIEKYKDWLKKQFIDREGKV